MERLVGTISRGVRAPIIRQGDDLAQIVVDSVLAASKSEGFSLHDRDVVAVTEAVVARAQATMPTSTKSPPTSAPNWAEKRSASSSPS